MNVVSVLTCSSIMKSKNLNVINIQDVKTVTKFMIIKFQIIYAQWNVKTNDHYCDNMIYEIYDFLFIYFFFKLIFLIHSLKNII